MPLSLPRPRPDRPRKRVQPVAPRERELPTRTYAFDPDAARKAWRQVARTRGAYGMNLGGRERGNRLGPIALGLAAVVAAILWWASGDEPGPAKPAAVVAEGPVDAPAQPEPSDEVGLDPLPEAAISPESYAAYDPPETEPLPRRGSGSRVHLIPPDTPPQNAQALRKLPHATDDRVPVGGIGAQGLHIDRITMGTAYESGACSGPVGKFSIRDDEVANVCFRAVHRRVEQRVRVLWEKEGTVVRRAFVKIGDGHAYRTRAVLPLRRSYAGHWKVRIVSSDGIELAAQEFEILR